MCGEGIHKTMKLCTQQSKEPLRETLCENVSFNPSDLPFVGANNIIEISQTHNDTTIRFLVKVPSNLNGMPEHQKDNIHIPKKFFTYLKDLRNNFECKVKVLNSDEVKAVSLHYAELLFKDQYYSRSDMLRMRNTLMGTILYLNENVEKMKMRARVEELFSETTMVTCGLVTERTRISFRSATAQVHIFLQMSKEMWQFDNYGQLLIEKALDGYLHDLFELWSEKKCEHDVTITLFSRAFYDAKSIEDFPKSMREYLKKDHTGRFYEDYYRVVVQNECYTNWMPVIQKLKLVFATYDNDIFHFHEGFSFGKKNDMPKIWNPIAAMGLKPLERSYSEGKERSQADEEEFIKSEGMNRRNSLTYEIENNPPVAYNSSAAEGNVLEVINMALNVYEKFYIDRCFERTGKISLIISPGNGVFEVNRDLMNITKQRSIDIGSSCDVICLGERPTFAVPLFKINQVKAEIACFVNEDDYHIPYWLNLSFYTSRWQDECNLKQRVMLNVSSLENTQQFKNKTGNRQKSESRNSFLRYNVNRAKKKLILQEKVPLVNYDDYDAKVFKYQSNETTQEHFTYLPYRSTRFEYGERRDRVSYTIAAPELFSDNERRGINENNNHDQVGPEDYLSHSYSGRLNDENNTPHCSRMVGSVTTPYTHFRRQTKTNSEEYSTSKMPVKTLINPFCPSRFQLKATSNRTRWSHAYPSGLPSSYLNSENNFKSLHCSPSHESIYSEGSFSQMTSSTYKNKSQRPERVSECSEAANNSEYFLETPPKHQYEYGSSLASSNNELNGSYNRCKSSLSSKHPSHFYRHSHKDLANIDGCFEYLPLNKSIDWKSMTIPPILPITNDYCPENDNLEQNYLFAEYSFVSEEIENYSDGVYGLRKDPTLKEVFNEMIYQRVAQGFQIVIPKPLQNQLSNKKSSKYQDNVEKVMLSMGRLFHYLTIHEKDLIVRRYFPRHRNTDRLSYDYSYRFQVPDSFYFDSSVTIFNAEPLDNYNWNYIDRRLLSQGKDCANMSDKMKFWSSRYVVLPSVNSGTKEIFNNIRNGKKDIIANIYTERNSKEKEELVINFIKFVESVNSISNTHSRKNERRGSLGFNTSVFLQKSDHSELKGQQLETSKKEQFFKYDEKTSLSEIIKAMLDSSEGLNFIKCQLPWVKLPDHSFSSPEAISWLKKYVNCSDPISYMSSLIDEGYICHASDDKQKAFVFGFKIYYILPERGKHLSDIEGYIPQIEQNFMEVEVLIDNDETAQIRRRYTLPSSRLKAINELRSRGSEARKSKSLYKHVRIDIDYKEGHRQEWGVLKHHRLYTPTCAFDLGIEWLVATGSILGEKVFGWSRKTGGQFHMLPVPSDPFALPFRKNSDPLRGPIYIPMDIKCLEFPKWIDIDHSKLLDFQDSVLKSFGFMRDRCITSLSLSEDYMVSKKKELPKYIHCTGGMLMMVVSTLNKIPKQNPDRNEYEDFIIKQYHKHVAFFSNPDESDLCSFHTVGFLWAWNFMLTKKWLTHQTGNEEVHDAILQDLRAFNSNKDGRLKKAWEDFKANYNNY